MKALVTGGTGFIGRHLVSTLLNEGWEVRCLARKTSIKPKKFSNDVEWIIGNLQSKDSLIPACKNVDVIFHLAGAIVARKPEDFFKINYYGTDNLVRAIGESGNSNIRLVFVSSQAASGPSADLKAKSEGEPSFPVSLYGESKLAAEIAVLRHKNRIHSTIVRPATVYGPGDKETLLFFKLAKNHIEPFISFNKRFISVIHVADLVKLLIMTSKSTLPSGEIFYAADSSVHGYSWNTIVKEAAKSLDTFTFPIFVPKQIVLLSAGISGLWSKLTGKATMLNIDKYKEMVQRAWICSPEKAKNMLGFEPEYDLKEGFQETANWYRQHGWI
jgi:nucleoside-diphosphate-sugar epimerase